MLHGVDFEAKPGEMIAIVGDSGSGKSTIAHLISRFYDASAGAVEVDGHDVRAYPLSRLRADMALVPQDVVVFAGTLKTTSRWGMTSTTRTEACLRAVRAEDHRRLAAASTRSSTRAAGPSASANGSY